MAPNTAAASAVTDCEVMAAVDDDSLVIAELCRDDAWISMSLPSTASLAEWA